MNVKVWVGFSDGKPHVYRENDVKCVATFPTRAEARRQYQDVRPAWMVIDPPKRKRTKR